MVEVLFFHAPWCVSCGNFLPIFQKVAKELESESMTFKDLDVEEDEGNDLASKFKIMNVPTIIVTKDGDIAERIVGTRGYADLLKEIEKWK